MDKPKPLLKEIVCENPFCKAVFLQKRVWQKYCSTACRKTYWKAKPSRSTVDALEEIKGLAAKILWRCDAESKKK